MGSYIPSTSAERQEMLRAIGLGDIRDLYADIPGEVLLKNHLSLPHGLSEMELLAGMKAIASKNKVFPVILRGAGAYSHFIPSIVRTVSSREEFVTAYTPYQAEISQGILQMIFEYQTMVCELTGMDVSNASVYDGRSAGGEATAMCRDNKRNITLVSSAVHPDTIATIRTYCQAVGAPILLIPAPDGVTDLEELKRLADSRTACVILQTPNFYGAFEDAEAVVAIAHAAGAKAVLSCNPIALAIMKTPGEAGADIAVAEGQPLGMPLSYGGPYLGIMAAKNDMMRKLPGRIVGETTDIDGKRAFVLTLQAREQHIRREKAGSNICTNEALCALTAGAYMSAMGPDGIQQAAHTCMDNAHYLQRRLLSAGLLPIGNAPFFHEFVTNCPVPANLIMEALAREGILGGLPVGGNILWCATETVTCAQMDRTAEIVREVCGK